MKKILKIISFIILGILGLLILIVFATAVYNLLQTPKLDRNWTEDTAVLPKINIDENIISVQDVRDWRYKSGEVISTDYYNQDYDLDKLDKLYLVFNPFGKWEGVGHFFLTFEFQDGKEVSVSIEARKEIGEGYSAIKGAFSKYELLYVFGSSADLMSRRVIYHNEDLYLYPLKVSKESIRALFLDISKQTKDLETTPRFYNTVTSNCTNLLADSANRVKEGTIPFHYSRLFTGFTDDQLYELGLIENDKSFDKVYEEARVDLEIKEIFEQNLNISKEDFLEELIN